MDHLLGHLVLRHRHAYDLMGVEDSGNLGALSSNGGQVGLNTFSGEPWAHKTFRL